MKRVVAAAFVLVAATGCVASRPTRPLDAAETVELDSIRNRLAAGDVRIVAPLETNWTGAIDLLAALDEVDLAAHYRVAERRPGDVTLALDRVASSGVGWDAYLCVLTLGLYPLQDDGRETYQVAWTCADGRTAAASCSTAVPRIAGWIFPVVALQDDWRYGPPSDEAGPERHALLARLGLDLARSLDAFVARRAQAKETP